MQKSLTTQKRISVILPVYNESKNLPIVYEALEESMRTLLDTYDYEIIFVNDGSIDESWAVIKQLSEKNSNIKGINFSRNFGYQRALTAGYDIVQGDVIITMDSDMQHPPHIIPMLLAQWESGADIVYAKRTNREDTFLKKITAHFYYQILEAISDIHIPHNVNDFRLIDKGVLLSIKSMREHSRYLRGMIAWAGFHYAVVDFNQPTRLSGTTKYTWKKLFKIAFDGIANFSLFPLKLACIFCVIILFSGFNIILAMSVRFIAHHYNYNFIDLICLLIYLALGLQFLLLWLLGRNIGITYDQLKNRPLYIVRKKINF